MHSVFVSWLETCRGSRGRRGLHSHRGLSHMQLGEHFRADLQLCACVISENPAFLAQVYSILCVWLRMYMHHSSHVSFKFDLQTYMYFDWLVY